MHVIAGLKNKSAFRLLGLFIAARWTFSFASSATVPACFDGTRGGPVQRPARELGVVAEVCPAVKKSASPLICCKT